MAEKKSLREQLLRSVISGLSPSSSDDDGDDNERSSPRIDLRGARDLIGNLAGWAGKGKDEIVQMICREIGIAVAAVLKEPLQKIVDEKRLRVTLELVPKAEKTKAKSAGHAKRPRKNV